MKKYLLVSITCLILICLVIQLKFGKQANDSGQFFIAHAGGMIDGYRYTNSMEAVENAINHGFKFIELDLAVTTDDSLVFVHDWGTFNSYTVGEERYSAISYQEYQNRRILERLTPLTVSKLDSILDCHDDVFLVTDKISDPELIDKYFDRYKQRLLVECFSYDDYVELADRGYYLPMLSALPSHKNVVKWLLYRIKHCFGKWSSPTFVYSYNEFHKKNQLSSILNLECALFYSDSVCKKTFADSIFGENRNVKFLYVDEVE